MGRQRGRRSRGGAWVVVFVFVLAAIAGALLLSRGGNSSNVATDDPGVVHVHGLGIDPEDGTLYAATHLGVFRLREGEEPVRVADRYQDTMGFTVVGPGHFLASGHPSVDEKTLRAPGKPPLLGLIESKDEGGTWEALSLLGDADFHALAAQHGQIYGFDATGARFMTTADGRDWTERSTTQLVSFAVSPVDRDAVVAGTGAGVSRSADGGVTWEPMPGAPGAAFVAWDETGVWAATAEGRLAASPDGVTWQDRGPLPGGREPEALLAHEGDLYVATHTGIHRSPDGGRTWRTKYENNEGRAA